MPDTPESQSPDYAVAADDIVYARYLRRSWSCDSEKSLRRDLLAALREVAEDAAPPHPEPRP